MELDGLFASMWADQVSDHPPSSSGASIKKKASGYSVGMGVAEEAKEDTQGVPEPVEELLPTQKFSEPDSSGKVADVRHGELVASQLTFSMPPSAQEELVEFPVSIEVPDHQEVTQSTEVPIRSPTPTSVPIVFPGTEVNQPVIRTGEPVTIPAPTMAVTFGASVNSPPSRTGTPDPENEPKRKRISSQNFQRLARRISLTTRRQSSSSSIIPGLSFKRDQSPRVSIDDNTQRAEGSSTNDSPAGSLRGDDKGKSKKNKKKKGST